MPGPTPAPIGAKQAGGCGARVGGFGRGHVADAEAVRHLDVADDVVPIERVPGLDIAVTSVRAPNHVQGDEPVDVRIVTRATRATSARNPDQRVGSSIVLCCAVFRLLRQSMDCPRPSGTTRTSAPFCPD